MKTNRNDDNIDDLLRKKLLDKYPRRRRVHIRADKRVHIRVEHRDIVVMGASAGGLEALKKYLAGCHLIWRQQS